MFVATPEQNSHQAKNLWQALLARGRDFHCRGGCGHFAQQFAQQLRNSHIGLLGLMFLALLNAGCSKPDRWKEVPGGRTKVLVSFPPLYCFAKNVAGEQARVLSVLTTQGPHDYQPTAAEAVLAREANVLFYNGLELDDVILKIANSSGNKNLVTVAVAEAIPKNQRLPMAAHDHAHGHAHAGHDHHHHGEFDPHVWLGIPQAIAMVEKISATLQTIDKANEAKYAERAAKYIDELKALQKYGKDKLAGKMNRKLVTMHESLGYFAKSFDLDIVGSIQLRPNVDPDAAGMANLVKICKDKDVRVIAVEPQYPKGPAHTLQTELARHKLAVSLVEIDPFETAETGVLNEKMYIEVMKKNIDKLAKSLP